MAETFLEKEMTGFTLFIRRGMTGILIEKMHYSYFQLPNKPNKRHFPPLIRIIFKKILKIDQNLTQIITFLKTLKRFS